MFAFVNITLEYVDLKTNTRFHQQTSQLIKGSTVNNDSITRFSVVEIMLNMIAQRK